MKKFPARITLIRDYLSAHPLVAIFFLGVIVRIVVFSLQGPFDSDNHWGVIEYIDQHHTLPASLERRLAHHPPPILYNGLVVSWWFAQGRSGPLPCIVHRDLGHILLADQAPGIHSAQI